MEDDDSALGGLAVVVPTVVASTDDGVVMEYIESSDLTGMVSIYSTPIPKTTWEYLNAELEKELIAIRAEINETRVYEGQTEMLILEPDIVNDLAGDGLIVEGNVVIRNSGNDYTIVLLDPFKSLVEKSNFGA